VAAAAAVVAVAVAAAAVAVVVVLCSEFQRNLHINFLEKYGLL
jgi:hypothetical protein